MTKWQAFRLALADAVLLLNCVLLILSGFAYSVTGEPLGNAVLYFLSEGWLGWLMALALVVMVAFRKEGGAD